MLNVYKEAQKQAGKQQLSVLDYAILAFLYENDFVDFQIVFGVWQIAYLAGAYKSIAL